MLLEKIDARSENTFSPILPKFHIRGNEGRLLGMKEVLNQEAAGRNRTMMEEEKKYHLDGGVLVLQEKKEETESPEWKKSKSPGAKKTHSEQSDRSPRP